MASKLRDRRDLRDDREQFATIRRRTGGRIRKACQRRILNGRRRKQLNAALRPARFRPGAIRGTIASNLEEWVDNLTSVDGVAVPNFGNVGYGVHRIFETMQVIKEGETTPRDEFGNPLTGHKPFEWQVAEVVQSHAAKVSKTEAVPPAEAISVEVTGHSLGSALATLYVAKNANAKLVHVPRIYTFASPLVGNGEFVAAFAKLNVDSWRIANCRDVVTQVPRIDLKNAELFEHVEQARQFDSADQVNKTLSCLHSMTTYLHFVDPTHWLLDAWCAWSPDDDPGPNIGGNTPD